MSAGQAAIAQSGAAMRIDQSTARAVIDWQSFNTVLLASGDELRVDFSGDRLIEIKVDQAAVNGP